MSKEKQIEEMQTVINGAFFEDFRNGNGVCIKTISKHLYNAGYRKQSEVAAEIFAEVDNLKDDWKHSRIQSIQFIAELAELKKKYTGDQT